MKRIISILTLLISAAVFVSHVTAADNFMLSPGLKVIAAQHTMVKAGLASADIYFSADDFAYALGVDKVSKITVTRLPDASLGALMLGNQSVAEGQTIASKNLASLRFVPANTGELEASFGFCAGATPFGASYDCTVYALSKVNAAPVIAQPDTVEVGAYSGIDYLGSVKATDADGDAVRYEIVSSPSNGSIALTDPANGYYVYKPNADFEGKDSFEVRAIDKYGSFSNTVKLTLRVDQPSEGEVYSDMDGHWANAAVITCSRFGLVEATSDGNFYPNEPMSRAEFLSLMMTAAGYRGFTTSHTGFADDASIPEQYKGCIAAAEALGVISGINSSDGLLFCPNNQITRAEAAVMIARLTGLSASDTVLSVFADESVPAWAVSSMAVLSAEGILRGTGNSYAPYGVITRAAGAQLAATLVTR